MNLKVPIPLSAACAIMSPTLVYEYLYTEPIAEMIILAYAIKDRKHIKLNLFLPLFL